MGKKKRKKAKQSERSHTPLAGHKRMGKALLPPFRRIGIWNFSSWIDERLPDMLWAVLIIDRFEREAALSFFRRVVELLKAPLEEKTRIDLTLSVMPQLPDNRFDAILNLVAQYADVRLALRPMLLFPELPARERWLSVIGEDPVGEEDWPALMSAVALTLDHQSQEATDVRWVRVVVQMMAGRMHFAPEMEDTAKGIFFYPNYGDQHRVRPSIRASEIARPPDEKVPEWPSQFWQYCWRITGCIPHDTTAATGVPPVGVTVQHLEQVRRELSSHFLETADHTAIDPRHDAAFGLASYALALLDELVRIGNSVGIIGRLALRALLEATLTLEYLASDDKPERWLGYREYGAGQAKLGFLKLDELPELEESFVKPETLKAFANEDRWQEFQDIHLGHWDVSNLRVIAEKTNRKDVYDRYYPWSSAFVHANWAAVRNAGFRLCLNPLHRLHRVLADETNSLEDVLPDAVRLVDRALFLLDKTYPGFTARLGAPDADGDNKTSENHVV